MQAPSFFKMNLPSGKSLAATGLLMAMILSATQAAATDIKVLACPIYRDANLMRVAGCWLVDDPLTGIRYDVSDTVSRPDWNYAVLVEGRLAKDTNGGCGGLRLESLRTSVMYDMPCTRHMLPADGYSGRDRYRAARNVQPTHALRPEIAKPHTDKSFYLYYDFNKSFGIYQYDDYLLDVAIHHIRSVKPARIIVTGYADTRKQIVSGTEISETEQIARDRAEMTVESLIRLGVKPEMIEMRIAVDSQPIDDEGADGLPDQSRRRSEIRVLMN
ncbi:MAG: hypothetical protein QM645_01245 [Asticcacaulis sp.]